MDKCLNKIRPHAEYIINNLKKSDSWKIQMTIAIIFISSKGNDKERVMLLKSDNTEIIVNHKADEVIEELFYSPFSRYQTGLVTSMNGSDFVFD